MKREDWIWEVPQPISTCQVALDDGTATVLRRYGNVDGRRLILSHGNGLAIDLYYPFWSLLVDEFDLVLYDIRNHGRNQLGPISQHNVPMFIADLHRVLAAMDQRFGAKPRIGVFHSLSALIALLSLSSIMTEQVSAEGPSFSQLVLYDPPLFLPSASEAFLKRWPRASSVEPASEPTGSGHWRTSRSCSATRQISRGWFPALTGSWPTRRSEGRTTANTTSCDVPRSTRLGCWSTRAATAV